MSARTDKAASLKARMEGGYGLHSARVGRNRKKVEAISTDILSFDYMSGVGGFLRGHIHEVYGPTTIGKTSMFGFGTIRGAQKLGMVTAVIAVEPRWDELWAERHGVDPETTVVLYPDHLDEGFEMLRDIVYGDEADFVLFDSLGGGTSEKATTSDKGVQAYGEAGLITGGIKRVVPRAYKNNQTILFINQVRQHGGGNIPMYYDSPGGEALRHAMMMRVQVKPGRNKFKIKMPTPEGNEDVLVGQDINAVIKKNNAAESTGRTAKFRFFHIETEQYGLGVDMAKDVINTAKMVGVVTGSGWLHHPSFPSGKINGMPKTEEFLYDNPEVVQQLRKEVLAKMAEKQATLQQEKELKVINGGATRNN